MTKKADFYWFNDCEFTLYGPYGNEKEAREAAVHENNDNEHAVILVKKVAESTQPPRPPKPARVWTKA